MKRIYFNLSLMLVIGFCSVKVSAQQFPVYSMYIFNQMVVNPAYAGLSGMPEISLNLRQQWVGLEGAPSVQALSGQIPLRRAGVGITLMNDRLGSIRQTGLNINYAYHLYLGATKDGGMKKLSFGILAGATRYANNLSELYINENIPGIDIPNLSNVTTIFANAGAGIMYHTNKLYVGLSAPILLTNSLSEDTDAQQARHYFMTTGYMFRLSSKVNLKPNIMARVVEGAPVEVDINVSAQFNNKFWAGLTYRSFSDIEALFQIDVSQRFRVGYMFGLSTSGEVARGTAGTHELMLSYVIPREETQKMVNPRFF